MKLAFRTVLWGCCALGVTSAAFAADENPAVAFARHHVDGWNLAPAVDEGRIIGFLAWATPEAKVDGNIDVIWFERGGGSAWSSWGWTGGNIGGAVLFVQDRYADTTIFGRDGTLVVAAHGAALAAPTEKIVGAFFESDPIGAAVNDTEYAAEVAAALAPSGYAVAASTMAEALAAHPCEAADVATLDKLLVPITRQVEDALFTAESLAAERAGDAMDPCAAWPCAGCTAAYGTLTITPGSVTTTTITAVGARCKCESRTPATAPVSYTGLTWFRCNACPAAGTATGEEYCAEDIECPVPLTPAACPGGGCGVFVPL